MQIFIKLVLFFSLVFYTSCTQKREKTWYTILENDGSWEIQEDFLMDTTSINIFDSISLAEAKRIDFVNVIRYQSFIKTLSDSLIVKKVKSSEANFILFEKDCYSKKMNHKYDDILCFDISKNEIIYSYQSSSITQSYEDSINNELRYLDSIYSIRSPRCGNYYLRLLNQLVVSELSRGVTENEAKKLYIQWGIDSIIRMNNLSRK